MKQAFFVAFLLLPPLSAEAQTGQPQTVPSRSEMQSVQNEMVQQLQAKLQLQAQVLDLTAEVDRLRKQLAAENTAPIPPTAPKEGHAP
jgi:septal ring factor EnvC (AmiA/AmiB activator)